MAVRFDASGDFLSSTTNLLDYNSNYTLMMWVYVSVDTNADAVVANLFGDTNNYDIFGFDATGTTLSTYVLVGGANTQSTGTTLSTGAWHHITVVRSSTTLLTLYLDGVSDQTNTRDVTGRSAISSYVVGQWDVSFPLRFDGRTYGLKYWDTDLTAAEVVTEMHSLVAKTKLSNLNRRSPMLPNATERLKDYSPNKANWTANGTLTDEDPAPVSWGAGSNIIPFAAAASGTTGSGAVQATTSTLAGVGLSSNTFSGTMQASTATASGFDVAPEEEKGVFRNILRSPIKSILNNILQ